MVCMVQWMLLFGLFVHRVLVARATIELDAGVPVATVQTDKNVIDGRGPGRRCRQIAFLSTAGTGIVRMLMVVRVVLVMVVVMELLLLLLLLLVMGLRTKTKVTTGTGTVLVQLMVCADVVRIEGRLVVLRVVGMGWCDQWRLDQCHILVQQSMIIIVHAHAPHRVRLLVEVGWNVHAVPASLR
uniref:Secreted protein n=1 Tax=Anopheles darlingi TaxID=43151 RepID=A0A2M4DBY9_ANODA